MEAIHLETTDDKFLITVDKNLFDQEFVMRLVERLHLEYLAEKINFNNDMEKFGEDIKSEWWNNNKTRLLGTKR